MNRKDKEKILEALRHPNDADYWANGIEDIAKALVSGEASKQDQQELISAFWTRIELVVKVIVPRSHGA